MKLLTFDDLRGQPPIEWLVEGIIPKGALCMLYAPSGVGKSWLALDLAHHIATGRRWLGREVAQGPGLYVVAEGMGGFPQRVIAWSEAVGLPDGPGPMRYVPEPVRFHEPTETAALVVALEQAGHVPALMVVDTLHASIAGGSDSDSKDMGLVIDGIKRVQAAVGSAALVVHHTGWDTSRERGSSSIRASMDVVLALRPLGGGNLELKVEKLRDGVTPPPIVVHLQPTGAALIPDLVTGHVGALTPHQRAILAALEDGSSLSDTALRERSGLAERTYYRVKKDLIETAGAIEHDGPRFRITDSGRALLASDEPDATPLTANCHATATQCHGSAVTLLPATPLSKGVAVAVNGGSGSGSPSSRQARITPQPGREVIYEPGSPEEREYLRAVEERGGEAPLPLRLRVLRALVDGDSSGSQLAERIGVRKKTVLDELRGLRDEGLVMFVAGRYRLSPHGEMTLRSPVPAPGTGGGLEIAPGTGPGTGQTSTGEGPGNRGTAPEPGRNRGEPAAGTGQTSTSVVPGNHGTGPGTGWQNRPLTQAEILAGMAREQAERDALRAKEDAAYTPREEAEIVATYERLAGRGGSAPPPPLGVSHQPRRA